MKRQFIRLFLIDLSGTFDLHVMLSQQTNKLIQSKQVTKQFLQLINLTEKATRCAAGLC